MEYLEMEVKYRCVIDRQPIEDSAVYKLLTAEYGQEFADKWIYEDIMQNGSPELQEAVFIVTGGVAPGGKESVVHGKVS
jgi:hypothetical protein